MRFFYQYIFCAFRLLHYAVLFIAVPYAVSGRQVIDAGDVRQGKVINKDVSYLVDSKAGMHLQDVIRSPELFRPNDEGSQNFGYFSRQVWLKFTVSSSRQEELLLEYHPYHIDSIRLYCVQPDGTVHQTSVAGLHLMKQGSLLYYNHVQSRLVLPFEVVAGHNDVYLQLFAAYTAIRASLKLWQTEGFADRKVAFWESASVRYIIIGFSFFAALVGLLLTVYTRSWIYLAYSLFLLSNIGNIFSVKGWIVPYLSYFRFFDYDIRGLFNGLSVIISLWYFNLLIPAQYAFLPFRRVMPWIQAAVGLMLAGALLLPAHQALYIVFVYVFKPVFFLCGPLFLAHFYMAARNGYRLAWLYLLSLMPIVINMMLHLLQLLDIIYVAYPNYLWEFAILAELLLYTFAMVYRYKILVDEKLHAERLLEENQRQYMHNLFAVQENERIRIARDLHDSIGQKLSVIKMLLSVVQHRVGAAAGGQELEKTTRLLDETVQEVRVISHNLIPEELNLGLMKAIKEIAARINGAGKVRVEVFVVSENTTLQVPEETSIAVFRIVQEILSNMVNHAGASRIDILLENRENALLLEIRDNGSGFDIEQISRSEGIGWQNISARTRLIRGALKIHTERNKGTSVKLNIPL